MKTLRALTLAAGMGAVMATAIAASAEQPLTIHYADRPPLHYTTPQGTLTGFAAKPVIDALGAAGIPYQIRQTPAKRQLIVLQANQEPACMMSWLEAPGRERTGKFSDVIYQDRRPFALTLASNKEMENEEPLKETLSNPRLRLLLKEGFSYGPAIDRALLRNKPTTSTTTTGEARQMLEMLRAGRIDYFFVTEEEANEAFKATGIPPASFKRIYFSDMPRGYERHLWCTKSVPDEVLKRFNAALAKQRR
jgi:uncharacterized protein (TIGR02285 family)